jgi:hypothetical protein
VSGSGALAYLALRQTGPRAALAAESEDPLLSFSDFELDETSESRDRQHPPTRLSLNRKKRRKLIGSGTNRTGDLREILTLGCSRLIISRNREKGI